MSNQKSLIPAELKGFFKDILTIIGYMFLLIVIVIVSLSLFA